MAHALPTGTRPRFSESGLTFDYTLRPGPSTTRNAIALLEHVGYPKTIIDGALAHVEKDGRREK